MSLQEARTHPAFVGCRHSEDNRLLEFVREGLVRLTMRVTAWSRYRQTVAELRSLSDRELGDIGIARCDVMAVARSSAQDERTAC